MAGPWFPPKRYGIGAGLPIAWQGWAVLIGFVAGVGAAVRLLHGPLRPACIGLLILALIVVTWAKTEGGWRWRWGGDE